MRLKTKLGVGFATMVALTLLVGGVGRYAMENMDRQSLQATYLDAGYAGTLQAQSRMLAFALNGDAAGAEQTKRLLADSEKAFKASLKYMDATNTAQLKSLLEQLETFKKGFNEYLALHAASRKQERTLTDLSAAMLATLEKELEIFEKEVRVQHAERDFSVYVNLNEARDHVNELRLKAYTYEADPTAANAKAALDGVDEVLEHVDEVLELLPEGQSRNAVQGVTDKTHEYGRLLKEFTVLTAKSFTVLQDVRETVERSGAASRALVEAASKNIQEAKSAAVVEVMFCTLLALALGIGIAVLLSRNVQNQLGKDPGDLAVIARRVTGGDYAIDDGSRREGVYGDLVGMVEALKGHIDNARRESEHAREESSKAHAAMREAEAAGKDAESKRDGLLRAAGQLETVAGTVSSASGRLSLQVERSEHGAAEQAARVAETAAAMEEMNSTVMDVAKNAGAAADVSGRTRGKAEEGAAVVRKVVSGIEAVQRQSLALKEDMAALGGHAQAINQIMGVISDIADQTNLLALNAAIEAARAGEAGRGFAVVADEVRKLAEKTMTSTTDVGNAIRAIQQSADKNIKQVETTVTYIEEVTQSAVQSGAALDAIVKLVDATADQVRAIATASEQQSASSEEINRSITQVSAIAGETASAMEEATRAVAELVGQAQVLTGLIEEMKRS